MPKADAIFTTDLSFDPFALGGFADDATLLALFREWIEGHRTAARAPENDDEGFNCVLDRVFEIEDQIAAIPARGAIGLAVKVYIAIRYDHGQGRGDDAAAIVPCEAGEPTPYSRYIAGVVRDVAHFLPETEPLVAPFIGVLDGGAA